ncbi:MAG: PDZ domain-containing protein [Bacteroidota bacterium]|nr:PDZ domain-containing protein [Bacteroidota bacterium]
MKRTWRNLSIAILSVALIIPAAVQAQKEEKEDKDKKDKKDVEQIIITRKGDKDEKVVIELNGDKVIVNGKNVEDQKDGDITVHRNKLNGFSFYGDNFGFNDNMAFFGENENMAMLGVVTEKEDNGAKITEITKESGAEKAGLKEGDIITKLDDKKIEDADDLTKAVRSHKPGDKVTITYLRDKKEQKANAELGKWKGVKMNAYSPHIPDMKLLEEMKPRIQSLPRGEFNGQFWSSGKPKLGLSVQDTDDGKGVKVLDVDEEGNAAKAGVKENDIITHIDDKAVNSADEISKIIRESKDKPSIMIKLNRGGKTQNIEVKIPRKLKTADL